MSAYRALRTLALACLLAASALAALAVPAAAHPLAPLTPANHTCHYAAEPLSGGRVGGAPSDAPPYAATPLNDGCLYGHSPTYAGKVVGFHNNGPGSRFVTVYEAPAPVANVPLYQACLDPLPTAYDAPAEGVTVKPDVDAYRFDTVANRLYTIVWGFAEPATCATPSAALRYAPAKVVVFDTFDPVPDPDADNCRADPLDSRYDELCVGPHQDCDGVQQNRHDAFGRLTERHYTELCTGGGVYVCDGVERYRYGQQPPPTEAASSSFSFSPGYSTHPSPHAGSLLPSDWAAEDPDPSRQPGDGGYVEGGWEHTCAGVIGGCAGVWSERGGFDPESGRRVAQGGRDWVVGGCP